MSDLAGLSREQLIAEVVRLRADNAELRARVDRLERLISRNSGNSSMAPSTDDLPGKTPPADRPERGGGGTPTRKRGKQPGAPGTHLAWREDPDETVPHFPAGSCGCGADLAAGEGLGVVRSHQQHEIPLLHATLTQHDLHAVRAAAAGCMWPTGRPGWPTRRPVTGRGCRPGVCT